jgi:uncharacterized protein involved in exopolysaccharide biosynthesis
MKSLAGRVRFDFKAAAALVRAGDVQSMTVRQLEDLAGQVDAAARGLVGAAARLRRLAKQRNKTGAAGAVHDTRK